MFHESPTMEYRPSPEQLPDSDIEIEDDPEQERNVREQLLDLLSENISPRTALEILAAYDPKTLESAHREELFTITKNHGIDFSMLSTTTQEKLQGLYFAFRHTKRSQTEEEIVGVMEKLFGQELVDAAFSHLDQLSEAMRHATDPEQQKQSLRQVMQSLATLGKQVPPESQPLIWQNIYQRFLDIVAMKKERQDSKLGEVYSQIFEEFSHFIEDDLVAYILSHASAVSVEAATQFLYGRSTEEIEAVKIRNREEVAAAIVRMTEEPLITPEMLEELHAINNRGIVPKKYSKMRDEPGVYVTFSQRIGLFGEDIQAAITAIIERANQLIEKDILRNMSSFRYGMEAALLHNELLDVHPFMDRNGSTSLLFLELLMARKGYTPSQERIKNYYLHLAKVLDENLVAIGVVGYEQMKIAAVPGYSDIVPLPDTQQKEYKKYLAAWQARRKSLLELDKQQKKAQKRRRNCYR